jgi:hypothetical protein
MPVWQVLDQALLFLHHSVRTRSYQMADHIVVDTALQALTRGAAMQPEDVTNEEWSVGLRDAAEEIMTSLSKSLEICNARSAAGSTF